MEEANQVGSVLSRAVHHNVSPQPDGYKELVETCRRINGYPPTKIAWNFLLLDSFGNNIRQ